MLDDGKLTVVIEASNDTIWHKYTTKNDIIINISNYQTSGNGKEVYSKAGFNTESIVKKIEKALK